MVQNGFPIMVIQSEWTTLSVKIFFFPSLSWRNQRDFNFKCYRSIINDWSSPRARWLERRRQHYFIFDWLASVSPFRRNSLLKWDLGKDGSMSSERQFKSTTVFKILNPQSRVQVPDNGVLEGSFGKKVVLGLSKRQSLTFLFKITKSTFFLIFFQHLEESSSVTGNMVWMSCEPLGYIGFYVWKKQREDVLFELDGKTNLFGLMGKISNLFNSNGQ